MHGNVSALIPSATIFHFFVLHCFHHVLFRSLVKYGIGPFIVLLSLQNGTFKEVFLLRVFGPGSVFTNQWPCFGCFKALVAKFSQSFVLLVDSVSRLVT